MNPSIKASFWTLTGRRVNADLIVRAVNAHQYLVDVLEALKADIEQGNFAEKGAISMINTALTKAEGRE